MSDEQVQKLELMLVEIKASLKERCVRHAEDICHNADEIGRACSKIREVEKKLHDQDKMLAKWSILASIASAALSAGAVKFLMG